MPEFDPYEVLGISKDANMREIMRAYRELSRQYHQDKDKLEEIRKAFHEAKKQSKSRRRARSRERRDNVVMVRVGEEDLKRIDELVESGKFNSRSEAAAFLISEGIKSKQQMFENMAEKISQIQGLRTELAAMISEETEPSEQREQEA